MAQVTMDGREYVELISKVNAAEAERQLLIQTLIIGTLEVRPYDKYSKVVYRVKSDLSDRDNMQVYMQMRIKDVTSKLEENPLAVQLLFLEGEAQFNPCTGSFQSYSWDDNVAIKDMSETLGNMWAHLVEGELLVEDEEEE